MSRQHEDIGIRLVSTHYTTFSVHSAAQPEPTPIYNRLNTCFAFWVGDSDVDSQDQGSHKVQVLRENRLSRHS